MTEEDDTGLARRLAAERPQPDRAFRSRLRAVLVPPAPTPAPMTRQRRRALALIPAYACCGMLLLAVATAGIAGIGPLAA